MTEYINKCGENLNGILTVALDIPSGLGGDVVEENDIEISSVRVQHTLTFYAKKPVHLQSFAQKYCGEVHVIDIGIDEEKMDGCHRYNYTCVYVVCCNTT